MPATFGNPWPDAAHLTLSFVPDGTQAGTQSSGLFASLKTQLNTTPSTWQLDVLRAFQTWAVNGNANISIVPDSGQPLGAGGVYQGDQRFGDIRVAAYPLSSNVVAISQPFDVTAGTWSGDLSLNSAYGFNPKLAGGYDLFSVALHEAGHVFGLPESPDAASPMFGSYGGVRSGLTAADVASLQVMYGQRQADQFDGKARNDTLAAATGNTYLDSTSSTSAHGLVGDVTTPTDVDYYHVTPNTHAGPASVQLQTTGVSSLVARLTVYDNSKNVVDSVFATDPLHGNLAIHLTQAQADAGFYVKVEGASPDVFGIGSYQLVVRPDGVAATAPVSLTAKAPKVINANDSGTVNLGQKAAQTDARFDYSFKADLSAPNEVDMYRLHTPVPPAGTQNVMTVMVWGLADGGLDPAAAVFDASKHPVPSNLLVHDNGTYVLQVPNASGDVNYFIGVRAANPTAVNNLGGYFIGVDFGAVAVHQQTLLSDTVQDGAHAVTRQFGVAQSQLSHFVLTANSSSAAGAAVRLTVTDQDGNIVLTLLAQAGQSSSATVMLAPGMYTFSVTGSVAPGGKLAPIGFQVHYNGLSDPIGPYGTDPTIDPVVPDASDWWVYVYSVVVLDEFAMAW